MPEANRLSRMLSTAAVVVVFFAAFTAVASATDYYVRAGGLDDPWHDGLANDDTHAWKTISYAIGRDEVTAGDTIHVAAGGYVENVDVGKSITLKGEGTDLVIVTAADSGDHVFEVTAGYVNISGFTVMGAPSSWKAGVYLGSGVGHYNISNNIVSDNYNGIHLSSSSNNTLTCNNVSDNGDGIYPYSSSNNHIYHNNLYGNTREYSCGTNRWNTTTAGNYWDDYTGNDTDGDGIGDDPHPIPGGSNKDYHPMRNPWHEPQTPGDLNGDHEITPADATITLRIAAGSRPYDPTTRAAADVSGDGKVTSLDALMILQAAAGIIDL